jgi:hypothetical protein
MKEVGKIQFERLGRAVAAYVALMEQQGGPKSDRVIAHAFLEAVNEHLGNRIVAAGVYRDEARPSAFLAELIHAVDGIPF